MHKRAFIVPSLEMPACRGTFMELVWGEYLGTPAAGGCRGAAVGRDEQPEGCDRRYRRTLVQTCGASGEPRARRKNVMFHYGNGALRRALLNNNFQMSV